MEARKIQLAKTSKASGRYLRGAFRSRRRHYGALLARAETSGGADRAQKIIAIPCRAGGTGSCRVGTRAWRIWMNNKTETRRGHGAALIWGNWPARCQSDGLVPRVYINRRPVSPRLEYPVQGDRIPASFLSPASCPSRYWSPRKKKVVGSLVRDRLWKRDWSRAPGLSRGSGSTWSKYAMDGAVQGR